MTGQSRSAQEVQITIRSEQGATRPATATLTRYERGERMGRAVGFGALGLVGAGIFVFVPAVHLITTWLLPLAGLIAARSAWRTEAKLTDARGECPACDAKITLSGGQLTEAPLWDACPSCSRPLVMAVRPAPTLSERGDVAEGADTEDPRDRRP